MLLNFLGTGTSVGVPMIGCKCAVCNSADRHNRRRRSCLYVKSDKAALVVDTSPDFREEMLDAKIEHLDAVLLSHAHADHIFGFDDIRRFNTLQGCSIPAYGDEPTISRMKEIFDYITNVPNKYGLYRPMIDYHVITHPVFVGDIKITQFKVKHGHGSTGFVFEAPGAKVGYCSDCCEIPEAAFDLLHGLDVMAIDALRYKRHATHFNIIEAIEALRRIGAKRSYLTHIAHDLDHNRLKSELPKGIYPAYDGMKVTITNHEIKEYEDEPVY